MHIQKLKVRPKKSVDILFIMDYPDHFLGAAVSLCAPELATMLGCWAAKNDMTATGACAESAKALYDCMRTTVGVVYHRWVFFFFASDQILLLQPMGGRQHRPTINYHLARLNKVLK